MKAGKFGACAMALMLGGCATQRLEIRDFKSGSTGSPYQLSFTQFAVKSKWRLTGCRPLSIAVEATAVSSLKPDPTARYLLDSSSLEGWLNTVDFSTAYDENGNFKSLNVTIEDKTAETFAGVVKGVTQLVSVGSGLFAGGEGECGKLVLEAKTAEAGANAAATELERIRREALQVQADPTLSERERANRVARLRGALQLQEASTAIATKRLEAAMKGVTFEEGFEWPENGGVASASRELKPEVLALWAGHLPTPPKVGLALSLQRVDAQGTGQTAGGLDLTLGLPIRLPRAGRLVIERLQDNDRPAEVARADVQLVQSGDVLYVPVERRPLRSTTAQVSLHPNGQLASVGRGQKSAPAETFGKILETAAGQAKILADLEKTDLEKIQDENIELGARKTNADLKKALNPSQAELELSTITPELTLTTAKINLIKANQMLDGLQ